MYLLISHHLYPTDKNYALEFQDRECSERAFAVVGMLVCIIYFILFFWVLTASGAYGAVLDVCPGAMPGVWWTLCGAGALSIVEAVAAC